MPKYTYDLKTGVVLGGIIDSLVEVNPDTQYFPSGVLTDRPLLNLDVVWEGAWSAQEGLFANGDAVMYIRSGNTVSVVNGDSNPSGILIKSSFGEKYTDGVNNDYSFTTPTGIPTEYFIEAHYLGYRVARVKIIATPNYPYPM